MSTLVIVGTIFLIVYALILIAVGSFLIWTTKIEIFMTGLLCLFGGISIIVITASVDRINEKQSNSISEFRIDHIIRGDKCLITIQPTIDMTIIYGDKAYNVKNKSVTQIPIDKTSSIKIIDMKNPTIINEVYPCF